MKSRRQIERELCRTIIEIAAPNRWIVPAGVVILENFKTTETMTLEQAREHLGIDPKLYEQELGHFLTVRQILADDCRPGGSRRLLSRAVER